MTLQAALNPAYPTLHFPTAPCNALAMRPGGLLAFSIANTVYVYDTVAWTRVRTLHMHRNTVICVCWQATSPVLCTASMRDVYFTDLNTGVSDRVAVETDGIETILWSEGVLVVTETSGDIVCIVNNTEQARLKSVFRCDKVSINPQTNRHILLLNKAETSIQLLTLVSTSLSQSSLIQMPIPEGQLTDAMWTPNSQVSLFLLYPSELHIYDTVTQVSTIAIPCPCSTYFSSLLTVSNQEILTLHTDLTCSVWSYCEQSGLSYNKNNVILARSSEEIQLIHAQAISNPGAISLITSDLRLHLFSYQDGKIRLRYLEKLSFTCDHCLLSPLYLITTNANILSAMSLHSERMCLELALQGDIEVMCCREEEVHVALRTDTGSVIESWDVSSGRSRGTLVRLEGEVRGMDYSPCGLKLAVAEERKVSVYQREEVKLPFRRKVEEMEVEGECAKLTWTSTFGIVLYGGACTYILSDSTHTIPLHVLSICQAASFLLLSTSTGVIYVWEGREANPTQYHGDIITATDSEVVLYWKGREIQVSLEDMRAVDIDDIHLMKVEAGLGWTTTGIIVFRPADKVTYIDESPVLNSHIKTTMTPTVTPHFSPLAFDFESDVKGKVHTQTPVTPPQPEVTETQTLVDSSELRFWTIVKSFDATLRPHRSHHRHNISAISLENMRKQEKKSPGKVTNRAVAKSKTVSKSSQRAVSSKGGFSTPVKSTTRPVTQRKNPTSLPRSDKKQRPENDVLKLALDTSALLKTCFDSNRKRQVLPSDGESQLTDTGIDYSDMEGSCKSDSPSPGKRRENLVNAGEVFTTTQAKQREMDFSATSVVCRELIATSDSNPDCRANIFKACLFASVGAKSFQQTILTEASQRLKELGSVQEAVELLTLAGDFAQACGLLQASGHWGEAVLLARRSLGKEDVQSIVKNWAEDLCKQGEFLEAIRVVLEQECAVLVPGVLEEWGKGDLKRAFLTYCGSIAED